MPSLFVVVLVLACAAGAYAWERWSPADREIEIPFTGSEPPWAEVKAVLERMGCVIAYEGPDAVTGVRPEWYEEITVSADRDRLRVRSRSNDVSPAKHNQENVERFRVEWERRWRAEIAMRDPGVRAAAEKRAAEAARKSLWVGVRWTAVGVAVLLVLLLVPSRGRNPSGRLMPVAIALIALAQGLPRLWAGAARLRRKQSDEAARPRWKPPAS